MYGKSACTVLRGAGEQPQVWLKYCGTVGKPDGNGENKLWPAATEGPSLLDHANDDSRPSGPKKLKSPNNGYLGPAGAFEQKVTVSRRSFS
jgi:hypothetical protein